MQLTVYIVKCSDGSYYTGSTKQDIEARIWEHNAGVYRGYTFKRRPVQLVFMETFDRITDGVARERQIKGWNRAKKEALIALNYEALPELSRNYTDHPRPSDRARGMRVRGSYSPPNLPVKVRFERKVTSDALVTEVSFRRSD